MLSRDGIVGLVCLAASLGLLAATWGLSSPTMLVPVGPGFYPRIVLGITTVLSLALIVADVTARWRRSRAPAQPAAPPANYGLVLACFAIFGLYVAALPWIGFRISTFAFVAALQATMDRPQGGKRWRVVGLVALITTLVTYFLFERYLLVLLPRGRWTDF